MAIELAENDDSKVLEVKVSGRLGHEDYVRFSPEFDRMVEQHGKLRLLFEMVDFHGWDAAAFWDDVKIGMKHHADIERVAMVGDKMWEQCMSILCRPFTSARIMYFDRENIDEARAWINSE